MLLGLTVVGLCCGQHSLHLALCRCCTHPPVCSVHPSCAGLLLGLCLLLIVPRVILLCMDSVDGAMRLRTPVCLSPAQQSLLKGDWLCAAASLSAAHPCWAAFISTIALVLGYSTVTVPQYSAGSTSGLQFCSTEERVTGTAHAVCIVLLKCVPLLTPG